MEYEDSVPIERRPTLPVTEILAAEQLAGHDDHDAIHDGGAAGV
jgi:hypothetical protein